MNGSTTRWRSYAPEPELPLILDRALDLFLEYGYHGATVRQIAEQSGLSVPGLYYHFRNKQAILAGILEHSNQDLMDRIEESLLGADGARARFIRLIECLVRFMLCRRRLGLVVHELRHLEEPYRSEHVNRRDRLQSLLLAEVLAASKQNIFRTTTPHEANRAILVMCQGIPNWYHYRGPHDLEDVVEQYIRFSLCLVEDSSLAATSNSESEAASHRG